jgi:hypothetical protein
MSEFRVRKFLRLALVAACLPLGGLSLTGCDSGVEQKTLPTDEAPELQSANNAMADYMKTKGQGKAEVKAEAKAEPAK